MSDLIKREDAIKALDVSIYKSDIEDAINAIPSADRPQAEWIFHYRDKWMVKAECPKCHRRFEFSPRGIWKCCPMCETRMKGADDED
jgi:hypothetical protein